MLDYFSINFDDERTKFNSNCDIVLFFESLSITLLRRQLFPTPENLIVTLNDIFYIISIIYLYALPVFFSLAQIVLFLVVFRYDTPEFYKIKGDEANYHKAMSQIYSNYENEPFEEEGSKAKKKAEISCSNNQLNLPEVLHENQIYIQNNNVESQPDRLETNMQIESKVVLEVTKSRIPCYYWKALILWMLMAFFHSFTGIDAVLFYSNLIFTNGKTNTY